MMFPPRIKVSLIPMRLDSGVTGPVYWHETSETASVTQKQPEFSWISSGSSHLALSLQVAPVVLGLLALCYGGNGNQIVFNY